MVDAFDANFAEQNETGASLYTETGVSWFAHSDDGWEAKSEATLRGLEIPVERHFAMLGNDTHGTKIFDAPMRAARGDRHVVASLPITPVVPPIPHVCSWRAGIGPAHLRLRRPRRLDRPGHEAARLVHHAPFWQLGGTAVFLLDRPCRLGRHRRGGGLKLRLDLALDVVGVLSRARGVLGRGVQSIEVVGRELDLRPRPLIVQLGDAIDELDRAQVHKHGLPFDQLGEPLGWGVGDREGAEDLLLGFVAPPELLETRSLRDLDACVEQVVARIARRGKARIDDTVWRVEGSDLPAGTQVRVTAVDGAILKVEAAR